VLLFSITIISWKPVDPKPTNTVTKPANSAKALFERYADEIYQEASLQNAGLEEAVFEKAFTGYINIKFINKLPESSNIITIIDYNKPSREKRMWIVDLLTRHLLIHTWVAHGIGSGDDKATFFSNDNDSHASSIGFYLTDNVYMGKHGRSLHLDGLDEGFNDLARFREIVVHAAPYVSESSINKLGYLGRSWGCPAVSPKVISKVIGDIEGKTVMFINGNDSSYSSKYLDEEASANVLFHENSTGNSLASL
jgi:hypothetical protein